MGDASSLRSSVLWLLLLLSLAIHVPLPAMGDGPSANVSVRIEGASGTIFEGWVVTQGHNVSTLSGGEHHCDGTNISRPVPTATSALDDAARQSGSFDWDGTFNYTYEDYLITRIADSIASNTSSPYWAILVGYWLIDVGGCQKKVQNNDQVLFAFGDAFNNATHFLKLKGPDTAVKNQPFQLTVIDAKDGSVVVGANVNGTMTGEDGRATFNVSSVGPFSYQAEKPSSIRSNSHKVTVVDETHVWLQYSAS